jgi:hypothetical protein
VIRPFCATCLPAVVAVRERFWGLFLIFGGESARLACGDPSDAFSSKAFAHFYVLDGGLDVDLACDFVAELFVEKSGGFAGVH